MKKLIFSIAFVANSLSFGSVKDLKLEMIEKYQKADYQGTLLLVNKLPRSEFKSAPAYYIKGLAHFQLQQYEKANDAFAKAIYYKSHPQDVHYFYAQSLLAAGRAEEAKEQFNSSYRSNYNQSYSKYYVHYIEKEQNHNHKAIKGFEEISTNEKFEGDIRQPARYEMAKLLLKNLKDSKNENKDDAMKVYKELKLAYNMNNSSAVASDIERDFFKLDTEYKLEQETFANGMRKPSKNTYLSITENFYYDTNVATLSDSAVSSTPTDVKSFASSTKAAGSYRFYSSANNPIMPTVSIEYLKYLNNDSSLVYANNQAVYSFSINNSYNHTLFEKPTTLMLDVGYDNTQRDRNAEKKLVNWGSNSFFSVGEALNYFEWGFTQFSYKFNNFAAFSDNLSNVSHTISATQFWNRENNEIAVFSGSFVITDSETDTSDSNIISANASYIIPELYPQFNFTFGMGLSFIDPIESRDTRGIETLFNPSLKVTRVFNRLLSNKDIFVSGIYNYKLNNSKDTENYAYSKHEIGIKGDIYF